MKLDSAWDNKYRPVSLNDCILPSRVKDQLQSIVENGAENLFFHGDCGVGKSSAAKAIYHDLKMDDDYLLERSGFADHDISDAFATFGGLMRPPNGKRLFILNEVDGLSKTAQSALRDYMEPPRSSLCAVIMTTNFPNKILDALKERCTMIDFAITPDEAPRLKTEFAVRLAGILKKENATCDNKHVAEILQASFPNFRQVLKQVQMLAKKPKMRTQSGT